MRRLHLASAVMLLALALVVTAGCESSTPGDTDTGDASLDTGDDDGGVDSGDDDGGVDSGNDGGDTGDDDGGVDSGDDTGDKPPEVITLSWNFADGAGEWTDDVSDYSPNQEDGIEYQSGIRELPDELDTDGTGYFLSGKNISDDLFMFLKRRVSAEDGLKPNRDYTLEWTITFASDAPRDCVGIGGPPGESVYLKAGGSTVEPVVEMSDDDYRMNIDKSNQSSGGENASVVGTVETSNTECSTWKWEMLEKSHVHPHPVSTDDDGNLWLLLGTDSGFEGTSSFYYRTLEVELHPVEQ